MSIGLESQAYIFLIMAAYGAAASLVFDIFRSIHRIFKPSPVTIGIGDIIFWLILSISTFFALFLANSGQIRFFEFFAMILGSIIYFLTISKLTIFIFSVLLTCARKIFVVFLKIFLTIAGFLYKIIMKWILFIFVPPVRFIKKIWKNLIQSFIKAFFGTRKLVKNKLMRRRNVHERKRRKRHKVKAKGA